MTIKAGTHGGKAGGEIATQPQAFYNSSHGGRRPAHRLLFDCAVRRLPLRGPVSLSHPCLTPLATGLGITLRLPVGSAAMVAITARSGPTDSLICSSNPGSSHVDRRAFDG